jgi:hypothetical protein
MARTEPAASPVTLWRHRQAPVEAVRWDGTPEVIAVLKEWQADPVQWAYEGEEHLGLRVWGARDGYAGALRGDWLVRDRRLGAARYTAEEFAAAFEPLPPPRPSPAELWEQAGGNRDLYRGLLHEHGHILAPGDDGYDPDAPRTLPCGWSPS